MTAIHYAKSGELNIAYRVVGDGPGDLVYVSGWVTNVEVMQEDPGMARFLRRLASFSRLICFDKRGIGLSDPVPLGELPDLETRVEDLRAVMDAACAERADLFGHSEGGSTAVAFTAAYPERVERLTCSPAMPSVCGRRTTRGHQPWRTGRRNRRGSNRRGTIRRGSRSITPRAEPTTPPSSSGSVAGSACLPAQRLPRLSIVRRLTST